MRIKKEQNIPLQKAINSPLFIRAKTESGAIIPLGTGNDGTMHFLNFNNNPHLLVAGSVMSGKREFINSIITSLVLSNRADEVRLLLNDTTGVELPSYNGLPHLIRPVVTDLKESLEVFHWLESEAIARRNNMDDVKAVHILEHNHKQRLKKQIPYVVYVIYELSDLMMAFPSEMESLICKIARTSPGAGIHLVAATQRPATDVLSVALKTCFPARICFNVISATDSVVVLGMEGAEKLDRPGEMLCRFTEQSQPKLLHGFSISDSEIERLVFDNN